MDQAIYQATTLTHLAGFDGGKNLRFNQDQYNYFFGGQAGGKNALFDVATGSTGGSTSDKQTALTPAQVNAEYDRMRMAGDALGARNFGMKMHKRLFGKS